MTQAVSYVIFGALTTLVNYGMYRLLTVGLFVHYAWATAIAWLVSVLFAFVTNKWLVFREGGLDTLWRQFWAFVAARALSGLFDMGFMILAVSRLGMNDQFAKLLSNIVVIAVNYFLSKALIFKSPQR